MIQPALLFGSTFVVVATVTTVVLTAAAFLLAITYWYRKPRVDQALVRTGVGGARVAVGEGMFVIPGLHHLETIDLSVKTFDIHFADLICRENTHVEINVSFSFRVSSARNDIHQVAALMGCSRASDAEEVSRHFTPVCRDAVATVAVAFTADELIANREGFLVQLIEAIGTDINGFCLEDVRIVDLRPVSA